MGEYGIRVDHEKSYARLSNELLGLAINQTRFKFNFAFSLWIVAIWQPYSILDCTLNAQTYVNLKFIGEDVSSYANVNENMEMIWWALNKHSLDKEIANVADYLKLLLFNRVAFIILEEFYKLDLQRLRKDDRSLHENVR